MQPVIAAILADPALPYAFVGMVLALGLGGLLLAVQSGESRRTVQRRLQIDAPPAGGRGRKAGAKAGDPVAGGAARKAVPTLTERIVERATVFVRLSGPERTKQMKQRMIRAGFFDPSAVPLFFLARGLGLAVGAAAVLATMTFQFEGVSGGAYWFSILGGGLVGYLGPNVWLSRRTKTVLMENRLGFPDFMDLMGVCANAGLSMEAALERVSRELAEMYPVLGVHLQILCLEVRAGRSIEDALHATADRMDIAEVRAFATLLQQSRELGSSISDALRVFSDDMRHKRLSLAEEKAYALPAKLSVPVTACILPVVLFIAILPVIVRFNTGIN
jgi:tight adherence protein C